MSRSKTKTDGERAGRCSWGGIALLFFTLSLLAACQFDSSSLDNKLCSSDDQCAGSERCISDVCVAQESSDVPICDPLVCTPSCCEGACCEGQCIDIQSNPEHCGGCNSLCDEGEQCVGGECRCGDEAACADDWLCCEEQGSSRCVNPASDPANCGGCGTTCGEGSCLAGLCLCAGSLVTCSEASVCAIDLLNDEQHCGGCNKACALKAPDCYQGVCACGTSFCAEKSCCEQRCVDTNTDMFFCGSCEHACSPSRADRCEEGVCKCGEGDPCSEGDACTDGTCGLNPCEDENQVFCTSGCADLSTDNNNCGRCKNVCLGGQDCVKGACICKEGVSCDGQCVVLESDSKHCGACGLVCDGVCAGGLCACGGEEPVDLRNSNAHCGSCAQSCALPNTLTSCVETQCQVSGCVTGFGDCDAELSNGCEQALNTPEHCGACGQSCALCVAGRCVTADEWVQLSASKESSCALKADGTVWCWGVLDIFTGTGCSTDHAQPVQVAELPPIQKLALGTDHACALSRDGEVWCWGSNAEDQLATTTPTPTCKPARALDESDTPLSGVSDLFSGEKHSCALYADHRFACWGNNSQGELGEGGAALPRAHLVLGEDGEARWASSLCLGIDHACAIGEDNRVECWGKDTEGRLSDGNIVNALSLSCGKEFACALVADPSLRVRCWGKATDLQLGYGSNASSSIGVGPELSCTPKLLTTGEAHACVVCDDGQVLCWGKNNRKQSCSSADQDVAEPCVIRSEDGPLSLPDAVGVAGGNEFSCVGTPTELFCWGRNNVLQLGDSHSTDCSRAQPVCSSSSCPPPC